MKVKSPKGTGNFFKLPRKLIWIRRNEAKMPTCPHCGTTAPEGAVYCSNCGVELNTTTAFVSATTQTQTSPQTSSTWPKEITSDDMQMRFEKAMKRAELLGYAAAGLGVAILVVIVVLSLLP